MSTLISGELKKEDDYAKMFFGYTIKAFLKQTP